MSSKYEASLRDSTDPELLVARMMLQGRRNLALFVGLVAFIVILWTGWSYWMFTMPAIIWFAAARQHFHAKLIDIELERRRSEQKDEVAPAGERQPPSV